MVKKRNKLLTWCIILSIILTQMHFTTSVFAATAEKSRIYGSGRIQTAIQLSREGWKTTSDYAVIATAYNFPDALCAAPLAKKYNAPLLLTDSNTLSPDVKAELVRLGVKNVIIVGGPGVVSDNVLNEVRGIAHVERIYGASREETSVEVAKKMGTTTKAVLATGYDFPDALSISSIAAAKGMPILLSGKDSLNNNVDRFLKDSGIQTTYIIGGTGVIGSAVESKVPGPVRLAGSGRVQTNYEVLNCFASELDFSKIYVATALDFPDALAGSVLAAMSLSPIVLADGPVLDNTKNLIKKNIKSSNAKVVALGGNGVVSDSIIDDISTFINNDSDTGTLRVQSVSSNGLNQIKVVYTQNVDEASAENPSSYELDGIALTSYDKIALQPDKKTVLITLQRYVDQGATKTFSIKENMVYSENTINLVPKHSTQINFFDVTVPAIKSVTASGDRKITIEFTEPVKMPTSFINSIDSTFKLDGQYLANFGYSGANAVDATFIDAYSNKIELNFSVSIPQGNHTLTIPAGNAEQLVDAAGFSLNRTSIDFIVSTFTSAPRVLSVVGESNGSVYVTYDRPMDSKTAQAQSMYLIGVMNALSAEFKPGTDNKVVKLVFNPSLINSGSNILTIDRNVMDADGNKLSANEDIKVSFTSSLDTEKPRVLSVTLKDSRHIVVKFSEAVDFTSATQSGNYTLMDSAGVTLSYISSVEGAVSNGLSDTFTINLNNDLTGTNYSLKITNVTDRATVPNMMDDYIARLNIIDERAPKLNEVVAINESSVVVYFNEAMDVSSLTNRNNIWYKNGNDEYQSLPANTEIEVESGNKSMIIIFPIGYNVKTSGWISSIYDVKGIRIANVKDAAGNVLEGVVAYKDVVSSANAISKPTYINNSFRLYGNNEKVWAEFDMDQPLSLLRIYDFRVAGNMPDAAHLSGSKVVLTFTDPKKVASVRAAGPEALLSTVSNDSANIAGTRIASISSVKVYDDQIAPVLLSVTAVNGSGEDYVTLKFSEKIDDSIKGFYNDDFTFYAGGTVLKVNYVSVFNDIVTFHFDGNAFNSGDTVRVKANEGSSSIKDLKDACGNQNTYKPILRDISGFVITAQ